MGSEISRVHRPRKAARASYDRLSGWYDWVSAPFERAARDRGLAILNAHPGEKVLELGFGTGWGLIALASSVGPDGMVCGIDQSAGMLSVAQKRIDRQSRAGPVELTLGDAMNLPLQVQSFDALFLSFTLELFDTPEISDVLLESRRVLRPAGRICVVSLSKSEIPGAQERLYETLHSAFPTTFDCRPIHVGSSLSGAGFKVMEEQSSDLWGLPVAVVLATLD